MVAKTGTDHGVKWRLAPALVRLVAQLDRAVPHRDRVSDGSIASHQHHLTNPRSDHEPHHFQDGEFVTAIDITHNTKEGIYCPYLWDALLKSEDRRIKYVIFNRRIFNDPKFVSHTTGARRRGAWNPGPYDGSSPHTHHIHISIWGDTATDTGDWQLPEHLTFKDRQAHLEDLTAAAKRIDAVGHPPRTLAEDSEAIRAEAADPKLVEQAVVEMLGKGADAHSLGYALRFYRHLAGRIGFDGSKPERVANWLYANIQDLAQRAADTEDKMKGKQ